MSKTLNLITSYVFLSSLWGGCWAINKNYTWADFMKCRQYDAVFGYKYKDFNRIENIRHEHRDPDTLVNLKIAVLATRDAHILLSPVTYPKDNNSFYEIVLGAGGNSFSYIRKTFEKGRTFGVQNKTKINFSQINPTPFQIKVFKNGTISVFYIDDTRIVSLNDSNPISVNYLSFGSWTVAHSKWFFDCPNQSGGNEEDNDDVLVPVERKLSSREQLLKNFEDINYITPPKSEDEYLIVETMIILKQSNYLSKKSELVTRGNFRLQWIDSRFRWTPEEYDNLTYVNSITTTAWVPALRLLNGRTSSSNLTFFTQNYKLTIHSNGTLIAFSDQIELITWCSEDKTSMQWPNDINTCYIQIGTTNYKIILIDAVLSENGRENITFNNFGWNEWKTISMSVTNNQEKRNDTITQFQLEYKIKLERNRNLYSQIYGSPLIVALTMILLNFWASHPYRTILCTVAIIILTVMFLIMSNCVPFSYVPMIMQHYVIAFGFAWLSLVIVMVSSWLTKHSPTCSPYNWIIDMLENSYVRNILLLGNSLEALNFNPWMEFSLVLDRLFFIINVIIICVFAENM